MDKHFIVHESYEHVLLNLYVCLWPFMYEKSHSHVKAIQALNNQAGSFVDATGQSA